MTPPSMTPNWWRKFPGFALDIVIISSVLPSALAQTAMESLSMATSYVERKCGPIDIGERYESINLDYDPIIYESFARIESGDMILLSNLQEKIDDMEYQGSIIWHISLFICNEGSMIF